MLQFSHARISTAKVNLVRSDLPVINIALDPLRSILQTRVFLPSLDYAPRFLWYQHFRRRLEPLRLHHKRQHDPRSSCAIGHAGVPKPNISDDQTAFPRAWLYRRAVFSTLFEQGMFDGQMVFARLLSRWLPGQISVEPFSALTSQSGILIA
jgi:hypothetical protein